MTSSALLSLYHRAPAPLQTAAATTRGLYLRSWRYGEETERLAAEARERETLPAARWKEIVESALERTLADAASRVPYYRAHWTERWKRGGGGSHERLECWRPALKDLTDYLEREPDAPDLDDVRVRMMELSALCARLN